MTGRISGIQTLGALDGPGVRFVAFLQGCPLRCVCCHNPETWDPAGGREYTAAALAEQARRYRPYFGKAGGITLSGGEPLLQAAFATEVFRLCHAEGLHTCLDTSGCLQGPETAALLDETDYCMLDIKYADEEAYRHHVGCALEQPLAFLRELERRKIPTRIRQVIIPGLNDTPAAMEALARLTAPFSCIGEWELLPFRSLCREKYQRLNRPFPLENTPEADPRAVEQLHAHLMEQLSLLGVKSAADADKRA